MSDTTALVTSRYRSSLSRILRLPSPLSSRPMSRSAAEQAHPFVSTIRPVNVASWQSVPVKSASIRVASAVPTLPNVPRQPRGEVNSPCVLICVGGLLLGDSAVDPVVSMVSHGCVDLIVARNDCMFVCGTISNVHVMSPLVGVGGFGSPGLTWIVTVPRQVPAKNDVCPDGPVGVGSRPQLASAEATRITSAQFAGLVIASLLPGPQRPGTMGPQ